MWTLLWIKTVKKNQFFQYVWFFRISLVVKQPGKGKVYPQSIWAPRKITAQNFFPVAFSLRARSQSGSVVSWRHGPRERVIIDGVPPPTPIPTWWSAPGVGVRLGAGVVGGWHPWITCYWHQIGTTSRRSRDGTLFTSTWHFAIRRASRPLEKSMNFAILYAGSALMKARGSITSQTCRHGLGFARIIATPLGAPIGWSDQTSTRWILSMLFSCCFFTGKGEDPNLESRWRRAIKCWRGHTIQLYEMLPPVKTLSRAWWNNWNLKKNTKRNPDTIIRSWHCNDHLVSLYIWVKMVDSMIQSCLFCRKRGFKSVQKMKIELA